MEEGLGAWVTHVCTYVELHVGEALAYASVGIADDADVLDLALRGECPPEALLDVRGDLVALLLDCLSVFGIVEDGLVIDEAQVADKDAPAVVCRRGVRNTV